MADKTYELITKSTDILIQALSSIKQLTEEYAKTAEHERKLKENREKPPRVHFENQMPRQEELFRQGAKPHSVLNGQIEDKDNKFAVVKNEEQRNIVSDKRVKIALNGAHKNGEKVDERITDEAKKSTKGPKELKPSQKGEKTQKADKTQKPQKADKINGVDKADKTEQKNTTERPGKIKPAPMQKPKMPMSAFLRFNRTVLDQVRKQYPQLTQTDLVTVTGHMWKELPEDEKAKYDQAYQRDKERYDAEMLEYYRRYPEQKTKKQLNLEKRENK